MLLFSLIPLFGQMFNGFSYITNRWSFAAALIISNTTVFAAGTKDSVTTTTTATTQQGPDMQLPPDDMMPPPDGMPEFMTPVTESGYVAATQTRDIASLDAAETPVCTVSVTVHAATGTVTSSSNDITITRETEGRIIIDSSSVKDNLSVTVTGSASQAMGLNITAHKKAAVVITLDNTTFTSGLYPCINVESKSTVYLTSPDSSTSTLTDGRQYGTASTDSTKGSIYAKGAMVLTGSGKVTLTEHFKHGFYAKDYIHVFGGSWNVNSTGRNAFQSVNAFIMDDGQITITGTGTHANNESRGIIVEGTESTEFPGEGYIEINGGTITSTTVSKGISAKWDIDEDAETDTTSDDPFPVIRITGGTISITTTGRPMDEAATESAILTADGKTEYEKLKLSPEGIEGKQAVEITGGTITLNTTDDCINASNDLTGSEAWITISGGTIYCASSANDGIDSNGIITISGGVIVAEGTAMPECAFDCDQNKFQITGGLLVGLGTGNFSSPTAEYCKNQGTLVLSGSELGSAGTTLAVKNSSGHTVFAYTLPAGINTANLVMILSSPALKTGDTYTLYTGVKVKGGENWHGLYTTLPKVSGGTKSTAASNLAVTDQSPVAATVTGGFGGGFGGSFDHRGFRNGPDGGPDGRGFPGGPGGPDGRDGGRRDFGGKTAPAV